MQELNRQNQNIPKNLPLKVMQFGGGNFLRAFVDWMIHVLNEETDFNGGVAIIKPTERGDYKDLKAQEGLFTVVLDGIKNGQLIAEKTVINCVQEIIHAYTEWKAYLDLAKNADIRFIVSNTTEAGIRFNENDGFTDNPPKEFPAKLTLWLYQRFVHFNGAADKGCIMLPCELIEDNGAVLKQTIISYADHWNLEQDFKDWIDNSNYFGSTLVDRIVSGYPSDRETEIQIQLGYIDDLLVAGEYYHSWVIQGDDIIQKELPFDKTNLNVQFVKDLAPYREMKVRILNGAHTSMVPVGYLSGIRFVKEAMNDETVSNFVETLLKEEVAKTLDFPLEIKENFITDVLDRFRNPLLKHQLISISLNSTSKFVSRLLPTLKDFYASENKLPKRIVFGLSALIRMYGGTFNGENIVLNDEIETLNTFKENWKKYNAKSLKLNDLVEAILSDVSIWGEDLTKFNGLVELVTLYIKSIDEIGVKQTLKTL